jgi:hypothetical protein
VWESGNMVGAKCLMDRKFYQKRASTVPSSVTAR